MRRIGVFECFVWQSNTCEFYRAVTATGKTGVFCCDEAPKLNARMSEGNRAKSKCLILNEKQAHLLPVPWNDNRRRSNTLNDIIEEADNYDVRTERPTDQDEKYQSTVVSVATVADVPIAFILWDYGGLLSWQSDVDFSEWLRQANTLFNFIVNLDRVIIVMCSLAWHVFVRQIRGWRHSNCSFVIGADRFQPDQKANFSFWMYSLAGLSIHQRTPRVF